MPNEEHLDILKRGVSKWNRWRAMNPKLIPDLSSAHLEGQDLSGIDFRKCNLSRAFLNKANLRQSELSDANLYEVQLEEASLLNSQALKIVLEGANLRKAWIGRSLMFNANLINADLSDAFLQNAFLQHSYLNSAILKNSDLDGAALSYANLADADLSNASLSGVNLTGSNLSGAKLSGADLSYSNLVETNLCGTDLTESNIYGASVWNIEIDEKTKQNNLKITQASEPTITVDNLEVAQFIYLLLNNQKIREVINTITSKVVLILGRFTPERKLILDAIRNELRKYNYTPVLFDFEKPDDRSFIETVGILAHMARFVIADFTEPKIVLQEAQYIIPNIAIPFAPIFLKGSDFEPVTLRDLRKGRYTVLDTFRYDDCDHLLSNLTEMIIKPAEHLVYDLNNEKIV